MRGYIHDVFLILLENVCYGYSLEFKIVDKILSLAACQSSLESMQRRCPHPGAERVPFL